MIKFQNSLVVILILTASLLSAQDYKFGKVSKEELEEKFSRIDSSATAEYLYKYRKTNFEYTSGIGFKLVTRVHERIKIYTKDGFDYATKKVVLFKNSNSKEEFSKLKAKTYNLEGGKIEETPLKKDGEFKVALSDYRDQKSFTMPNIKEGSIIEYKYEVISPFISNVDEFVFQHDIPIRKLEATLDSPEYFVFRMSTKGFFNVIPKIERVNRTLNYERRVADGGGNGTHKGLGRTKVERGSTQYMSSISKYEMSNVPALKDEPYVNELSNYRSGVKYELSYTQFPNSSRKLYATTWEAVVKTIYDSSRFGDELKRTSYFKDDVDALLADVGEPQEKMLKIFNLVKSKVKWNDFYGKYTRDGVKKAYKEGVGNVAEINLILTSMLSYAGLKANPVLISTRDNGVPLFPTREGFNYVLASVELEGKNMLLDACNKYTEPNLLPVRTQNWSGRVIKEDGSSTVVPLVANKLSKKITALNVTLKANGDIQGKERETHTFYKAYLFRNNDISEDDYLEKKENANNGMEISNYQIKNKDELGKSIIETYDFSVEKQADVIGDKLYFAPLFFKAETENPFKLEKRDYPIDFVFPWEEKVTLNIEIPDGYEITSMPESMNLSLPNGMGSFKYRISKMGPKIQMMADVKINRAIIPAQEYAVIKELYKNIVEKETEKVVLSKITSDGTSKSADGGR